MKISKNLAYLLAVGFVGVIGFSGCGSESSSTKSLSDSQVGATTENVKSETVPLAMTASARRTFVVNEVKDRKSVV